MFGSARDLSSDEIAAWIASNKARDPAVGESIAAAMSDIANESAVDGAAPPDARIEMETIVLRTGRPVLPVREDRISTVGAFIESDSVAIVKRARELESRYAAAIPAVGRIDVANSMLGLDWIGTGWLVDHDIVITNRHVAELVAAGDGGRFVFRPGRNGAAVRLAIDFAREVDRHGEPAFEVERVIWIEQDPNGPDLAFLKLNAMRAGSAERTPITFRRPADRDPTDVIVVGYPARAPRRVIPEQELMERIFNGLYDVKRVAPGLWGGASLDGWATHDCTTLGGNSGSVVLDMNTGRAVALHFAGAFLIENYAVPIATVERYLREQPWTGTPRAPTTANEGEKVPAGSPAVQASAGPITIAPAASDTVQVTIPLHLTLSLGKPRLDDHAAASADGSPASAPVPTPAAESADLDLAGALRAIAVLDRHAAGRGTEAAALFAQYAARRFGPRWGMGEQTEQPLAWRMPTDADAATLLADAEAIYVHGLTADEVLRLADARETGQGAAIAEGPADARLERARRLVVIGGRGTAQDLEAVAQEATLLPDFVMARFEHRMVRIIACRDSVTDFETSLRGVTPRGWDGTGRTWDDVPGTYFDDRKRVVIATIDGPGGSRIVPTRASRKHGSASLTVHESLHGYDYSGGHAVLADPVFVSAREKDRAGLDDYQRQAGQAGLEETFAESGARFVADLSGLQQSCPNLFGYWQHLPSVATEAVAPARGLEMEVAADGALGVADVRDDGTLVLDLRAEGPGGLIGHAVLEIPPNDLHRAALDTHLARQPVTEAACGTRMFRPM